MLQRIILTVHVLLVVAGIGLFLSGPIGRGAAAAGIVERLPAGDMEPGPGVRVEALRAAGALLMGAGLLGLTRQQPVK